jgi:hypothetical protein
MVSDNLLKILRMSIAELKEFHCCQPEQPPYLKVKYNDDVSCGYCHKKLYDCRTDRMCNNAKMQET